jgi:hypothetical protein
MKKAIPFILLILLLLPIQASAAPSNATIPSSVILDVEEDDTVTIKVYNFPADDTLKVRMGDFGTRGVGGTVVDTQNSGSGTFTGTYAIPNALKDNDLIAIRLESPTTGYYAYDWFWNNDNNEPLKGSSTTSPLPAGKIPTFAISNVKEDKNVTINPKNFPANDTFKVRMGDYGTRGVGGTVVETVTTDGDGDLSEVKFKIPASLYGLSRIAIRLESPTSGYYSYNWFYNSTGSSSSSSSGSTGTGGLPSGTYPTFYITAVDEDDTVTIKPYNFTPNDEYTVRMGVMGSRGVGGTIVDTVTTNANGKLDTTTFNIPAALVGDYQIAIRLESNNTAYYAFNWFYNNDHP